MRDKNSKSNINNVSGNVWRSPITMGILTWIGFILALIDFFPMYKIVEPVINLITNKSIKVDSNNIIYVIVSLVIMFFLVLIVWLRSITKKKLDTLYSLIMQ